MSDITPVILLKTKSSPDDAYEVLFSCSQDGFTFKPIFVPVMEHRLQNAGMDRLDYLISRQQVGPDPTCSYGGLIFTSQRAVEAFAAVLERFKGNDPLSCLDRVPVYTVGPATARTLTAISTRLQVFGSHTGNGKALAHHILDHYHKWYSGRPGYPPLLFVGGEQRRDIIPKTLMDPDLPSAERIQVDELVVYATRTKDTFEQDFRQVINENRSSKYQWVVVFSPTGCEAMLRGIGVLTPEDESSGKEVQQADLDSRVLVATIGSTTKDYLGDTFGVSPDVCAQTPSPEGVFQGIVNFMSKNTA